MVKEKIVYKLGFIRAKCCLPVEVGPLQDACLSILDETIERGNEKL